MKKTAFFLLLAILFLSACRYECDCEVDKDGNVECPC